jgi:cellulose synthase/poly-beta-1,6-N-acetylglucosamine synthase-like glycosyltransferase
MISLSILIPVFDGRVDLLELTLQSIKRQSIMIDYEIIILNDGTKNNQSEQLASKYNCKYIFTGQRNINNRIYWRSASWPFNIGIKECTRDLLLLQEPEVYHLNNNSINQLVALHLKEENIVTHLNRVYIDDKSILQTIKDNRKITKELLAKFQNNYHAHYWYSLCIRKSILIEMRGISELMYGSCYDDGLFYDQLINKKLKFIKIESAEAVHLFHPRINC